MTDYLTPALDSINATLQQRYEAQGGGNHKFIARTNNDEHFETTVNSYNWHYEMRKRSQDQIERFEETLGVQVRNGDIDIDTAVELADCFGIDMSRLTRYCVQVEFTFTAEVPLGIDPADFVETLGFDLTSFDMSKIDGYDSQILSCDWEDYA